jgi:acetylornithine aminotransferase
LCNSGAEANENALKLASFHNGKKKVITFSRSFHGRTAAAVAATDNKSIIAPINESDNFIFVELNNEIQLKKAFEENEISSVIVEGIQGIGGVYTPSEQFLGKIQELCQLHQAIFICDEVQSGYGRSGKFFAHQHFEGIKPDIISVAKGMGNGFPVGGILISPKFEAKYGMLGTTFGGNYLACVASLAVLEIIEKEHLVENARVVGDYLLEKLKQIPQIKEIRGKGLMVAIDMDFPIAGIREKLSNEYQILTGTASAKNTMRILPPLTISKEEVDIFLKALERVLKG